MNYIFFLKNYISIYYIKQLDRYRQDGSIYLICFKDKKSIICLPCCLPCKYFFCRTCLDKIDNSNAIQEILRRIAEQFTVIFEEKLSFIVILEKVWKKWNSLKLNQILVILLLVMKNYQDSSSDDEGEEEEGEEGPSPEGES